MKVLLKHSHPAKLNNYLQGEVQLTYVYPTKEHFSYLYSPTKHIPPLRIQQAPLVAPQLISTSGNS